MSECNLTGTVKDYDGSTIRPGTQLNIHQVLPGEDSTTIFGTHKATHTLLTSGLWSPLIKIERGAVAYISMQAPGFDRDMKNGTPLQIPDASSATLASLPIAVSLPSQVPVVLQDVNLTFVVGDNVESADSYVSIAAAVAAIGSDVRTMVIATPQSVADNLTIPSNVTLHLTGEGEISVAATKALTINGPLQAPLRQIFSGSGSIRFGNRIEKSYPEHFGAKFDNSTDDTVAIQAAIDAYQRTNLPHAGGIVEINGGAVITSTLNIHETSVTIHGPGWGISQEAPYRGFIRWNGSAGSPMIKIADCYNSGVENIRLIGKSTAKPSAAIEYTRTVSAVVQADHLFARHVYIGHYYGYDTDFSSHQFSTGILISGAVDTDTNYFKQVVLTGCDIGIDLQNPNASVTHYDTLLFYGCDVGFKCGARVTGDNWNFGGCAVDIELVALFGRLTLHDVTSEGAGMFALMHTGTELYIDDLGFQISNLLNVGGVIIDADTVGARLTLRNALFTQLSYTGATPTIKVRSSSGGSQNAIRFENIKGLKKANFDFQTIGGGNTDVREIFNHRAPGADLDAGVNDHLLITNSEAFEEGRHDFASKVNVFGGPLKVRQLAAPSNVAAVATGGTGTTRGYRVSAISGTGETLASTTVTVSGPASLDSTHYITVTWYPVIGADGYKVYGRTSGSEQLMATIRPYDAPADGAQVTSFKDTGAITPSGALPTVNTTGTIVAYLPDGNTSTPSLSRAADPTQGIVFDGIGFKVVQGGNTLATFASTGGVTFHFAGVVIPTSGVIEWGSTGRKIISGSGTPEGAVTASVGSLYLRTDGGAGTTLYIKESGSGNTGWVAK